MNNLIRFLIPLALIIFSLSTTLTRPLNDVAPSRGGGGGDCSLWISMAHANMAPPPEDCAYEKSGDKCLTWDGRAGLCEDICKKSDAPEACKDGDKVREILKCASVEPPCDPEKDENCKRNIEIRRQGYPNLEPSSENSKKP